MKVFLQIVAFSLKADRSGRPVLTKGMNSPFFRFDEGLKGYKVGRSSILIFLSRAIFALMKQSST